MLSIVYEHHHDVIDAVNVPCVSVIMPFDPKMGQKSAIENRLRSAMNKVKKELREKYPDEKAVPVFQKLHSLIKDLNYSTHKKSIAILVSPLVAKVYYLDVQVKEKIIVDESFEIRDLVYSKKEITKYLVLVLTSKRSSIYQSDSAEFVRIVSNTPSDASTKNAIPELPGKFSNESDRRDSVLNKFLQKVDNGLSIILKSYPFPLFVIGTSPVIGCFKKLTHNYSSVLNYIHGNFEEASETEIRKAILPHVAVWTKVKQQYLLRQLNIAHENGKLSTGIEDVLLSASLHKGRLLVVSKNFGRLPEHGLEKNFGSDDFADKRPPYIKDVVDKIIEKVFENGGDIEFMDNKVLGDYGHIALVQY
jgi:hypothetical protein